MNGRRCGSNSRSVRFGEETNLVRSGIRTQDCPVPSTITIPTKQSDSILKYTQMCSANNINLNANYDYTNVIILIGTVFTFIRVIFML